MNKAIRIAFIFISIQFASPLTAQSFQNIKGIVLDKTSQQLLIGATVKVVDSQPLIGASTDVDGNFRIEKVPLGRHKIEVSFVGYEPFLSDNVILNSAKELELTVELVESAVTTQAVVVTAKKTGSEAVNELSIVSARSFTAEQTQRFAASANDPGRMAMAFSGVQPSRDSRSDIVVRGNAGFGLLWRLEGIDIPNPNHFARKGSSGGGITIFSTSMLGTSDFSSGAFPAEYGNAFSGVFDMKFRKGNTEKREYTAKAGLLGLDFSTEGPLSKNGASYLINYRYSTLGILNKMGIHLVGKRIDNTFQDLSFNLYVPSKNKKVIWTMWGMAGLSRETGKINDTLKTYDDREQYNFVTNMGAVGLTNSVLIDNQSFIKTTLAFMNQKITNDEDTITGVGGKYNRVLSEDFSEGRLSLASFYSRKLSAKTSLKTGFTASRLFYNLESSLIPQFKSSHFLDVNTLGTEGSYLVQPYAQIRYRATPKLTINGGIHALYFALNNTSSIEPRFGLQYQVASNQTFSFGYGLHGKVLPIGVYYNINLASSASNNNNRDLKPMKVHHFIVAYDVLFGDNFRFHTEGYYQRLMNVPVSADINSSYAYINDLQGFANRKLVSEGTGQNYGIDVTFEKIFQKGTFFILNTSLFNSTYQPLNGKTYSTQYNSTFSAAFIGGREWNVGEKGVFQLGGKLIFNGGQPITPLATNQEGYSRIPTLDETKPYSLDTRTYFRPDLRLAYRRNGAKSASTIALDIQNVALMKNIDGTRRTYDPTTSKWVDFVQSSLVPVLSWQIDFR